MDGPSQDAMDMESTQSGSTGPETGNGEGQNDGSPGDPPAAEDDCEGLGACAEGNLCDVYDCGGRPARYNHFGCARVSCASDDECPSGEACFALAFDRSCEPSSTVCAEDEGTCVCEATQDCDGVLDAHCLPTEFYPTQAYCDVTAWDCSELPAWSDALTRAAAHHAQNPSGEALAQALDDCASAAAEAIEACP